MYPDLYFPSVSILCIYDTRLQLIPLIQRYFHNDSRPIAKPFSSRFRHITTICGKTVLRLSVSYMFGVELCVCNFLVSLSHLCFVGFGRFNSGHVLQMLKLGRLCVIPFTQRCSGRWARGYEFPLVLGTDSLFMWTISHFRNIRH